MKRTVSLSLVILTAIALAPAAHTAGGPDVSNTKMLAQPAVSASHIAFIYAADLWLCDLDGRNVRRLTGDLGRESNPVFSPDGSQLAFSAQYDGNTDVYVMPATGGVPRRLTWHPGADLVQGFTPDGKSVLFTSGRAVYTNRYTQLFTVPVDGGIEHALPIPHASRASYTPGGDRIAYNPISPAFTQWKHYRGGRISEVYIYNVGDHRVDKIPQPPTRANDADPVWMGDTVYFRSDRNGEFNLYSFDPRSKTIAQLTRHDDHPVLALSAGGGKVVYEQAGHLHLFDPASKATRKLTIGVAADLEETRPRFVKGAKYVRSAGLSPSGARAVFEFRGEIVTAPAEKGDARNLTNTVGSHERSPVWSPDGRNIAYFSDETGEYELVVAPQDGKGERKRFKPGGAGFYERPVWAPDSRKISFIDNSFSVYVIDLKSGAAKKVASEYLYSPIKTLTTSWSPDSKWLAYTLNTPAYIQTVHVYSIDQGKSLPITDGSSEVSEPVFDRSGKYLFFFASTNAGPVKNWFALSNQESRITSSIYVAVLRKDDPSPLVKESDEEKGAPEKKDEKKEDASSAATVIDFDGLSNRILDLPVPAGDYQNLGTGAEGQVYYLKTADGKTSLQRFDLKTRKNDTVVADADDYHLSFDTKRVLVRSKQDWTIVAAKKGEAPDAKLNVDAVEVRIDPHAEWAQMFADAWRINRDYFKRYFYPQSHKEAVIIDERHNGGGSLADYYIDNLQRPLIAYWAMRYGADMKTPSASIQGPKVMIIDETAGSGGDLLPWMFRKFKVGTIVGRRTWGGLVGILGFPVLMDGGTVTAPNLAIWSPDKGWVVENEGVPPDVEVEQTPADVIAGRDPQLEKAMQIALDELKKNPASKPKRPTYPVKTLRGASQ